MTRAMAPLRRLLEALYPARCNCCDADLCGAPTPWFCGECWGELGGGPVPGCMQCGVPLPGGVAAMVDPWRCGACIQGSPKYAVARAAGLYDGITGHAVRLLKYGGHTGIAPALVNAMPLAAYPAGFWEVDAVVPVPLHPLRHRSRGFNQAAWLAMALGRRMRRPVWHRVLARRGADVSQVGRTRRERVATVRGMFTVRARAPVAGRSLLLVDDVMTTGATIGAAARALAAAGAGPIHVWTVARQPGG